MQSDRGNLRYKVSNYHDGEATIVSVERISDGHFLDQHFWKPDLSDEELIQIAEAWEAEHPEAGDVQEPTRCFACRAVLFSDHDTDYQFDNALWIGFHGGYGMWLDNLDATMSNNTEDRWLKDEDGEYITTTDEEGRQHPVDNPDWVPKYKEPRVLSGTPDQEALICHDCAHALWEAAPWLERLMSASSGHGHKKEYWAAHPDHKGWDKPATCCDHPMTWHREKHQYQPDKPPGCGVCDCKETTFQ